MKVAEILVLIGSYLPHEWLCDEIFFDKKNGFKGITSKQFRTALKSGRSL